ncbi:MAG TPA: hypothetical protein VGR37_06995 [Longimicrobiaceae bacterium]|nr:hypothetical protein [Longimicrobiaceae bacterium]
MSSTRVRARRSERLYRRTRHACCIFGVALLASCSDEREDPFGPDPGPAPRPEAPTGPSSDDTGDSPAIRRIGVDISATGSFRPGVPITVTTVARAQRPAEGVEYELIVLDAEDSGAGSRGRGRVLDRFRGALPQGGEHRLTGTVTFSQPGYYRIVATAASRRPESEPLYVPGRIPTIDFSSETLYVLVDESGGRVTRGPESTVIGPDRLPLYGSYGPFTSGRYRTQAPGGNLARANLGQTRNTTFTGTFVYYNDTTKVDEPIHDALLTIECLDANLQVYDRFTRTTDVNGKYSFTCTSGIFDGRIDLRNIYADVYGQDGEAAGMPYFNEMEGANRYLKAYNRFAAYVFATYRRYIPLAESRFGVYRRNAITAWVSPSDSTYPINYCDKVTTLCPREDLIRQNYTRTFGADGTYVTMHEYGHAFHYRAIERPATYYCSSSGVHYIDAPHTLSCAFVEGFATFFSVWLLGDRLTYQYYSDYSVEKQSYWRNGDGVIIEGAAAGFFYDLVDGSGDKDESNNTVYEESFDDAAYPGTFITNIMAKCAPWKSVTGGYEYTYYLDGLDQVVYCIEGNVSAETESQKHSTKWRQTWDGVTWSPTFSYPAGFSATTVRRLWKYNFYGVNP